MRVFVQIMSEFHHQAKEDLAEVAAKMSLMDERFKSLAKYFGEVRHIRVCI
jgi:hypothetical protein